MGATRVVMHQIVLPAEVDSLGGCEGVRCEPESMRCTSVSVVCMSASVSEPGHDCECKFEFRL